MSDLLRPLVTILSDGRFHSGSELGDLLGVSRAAVWKTIGKITDLGLDVHSVRGKGYRMIEPVSLLEASAIRAALDTGSLARLQGLEILEVTDSTNSHAMRCLQGRALLPDSGAYTVYLAEQQTSGKGRRGRHWVSPYGRNIYMTLVKQVDAGASGTEGMSLVVGLALTRALKRLGVEEVGVKWPNDVVCQGEKLAGILLEITGDVTGLCQLLIGVGINNSCTDQAMAGVDQPWTDLARLLGRAEDRNRLAAMVIHHIMAVMQEYENTGMAGFRDEWHAHDVMYGKEVTLSTAVDHRHGRAMGIADNGALVLETAAGRELVNGGEISLREAAS